MDKSDTENPPQLNTNQPNTKKLNTHLSNTHQSIPQATVTPQSDTIDMIRKTIRENIDYDFLRLNNPNQHDELDEIVELMVEIMTTTKSHICIAGENKPRKVVKSRFMKITAEHIEYVITAFYEPRKVN